MSKSRRLSRRTVLKGLGTAVALPLLEAMTPSVLLAKTAQKKPPLRMAFLTIPNGAHMPAWTPDALGKDFALSPILEPLAPFKNDLLVLTGLAQDKARAHGDGGGDHARAAATFLTGTHPRKTHGANIKAGVSVDQIAAQKIGSRTRFASLELGCDKGMQAGSCDTGYSCAYSSNISWRSESTPMAKEINPRLVFERLFGDGDEQARGENSDKRRRYQRSILDFVLQDAAQLKAKLGITDQRKLDEYLTSVRDLEVRVGHAEASASEQTPAYEKPDGIPKDYKEHLRLMSDLIVLAFQGDLTRITTFMLANEGSNRSYPFIEVPEGHHDLSHHGGNKDKQAKIRKINLFHMTQLAYLLEKLKNINEGGSSLLDNCLILYGSGISDGNRHNHDDLPILLIGKGGGTVTTGRHVRYPKETPLNNLFLSMLDRVESPVDHLGDSTGRLPDLQ
jgi:hypothetical protein